MMVPSSRISDIETPTNAGAPDKFHSARGTETGAATSTTAASSWVTLSRWQSKPQTKEKISKKRTAMGWVIATVNLVGVFSRLLSIKDIRSSMSDPPLIRTLMSPTSYTFYISLVVLIWQFVSVFYSLLSPRLRGSTAFQSSLFPFYLITCVGVTATNLMTQSIEQPKFQYWSLAAMAAAWLCEGFSSWAIPHFLAKSAKTDPQLARKKRFADKYLFQYPITFEFGWLTVRVASLINDCIVASLEEPIGRESAQKQMSAACVTIAMLSGFGVFASGRQVGKRDSMLIAAFSWGVFGIVEQIKEPVDIQRYPNLEFVNSIVQQSLFLGLLGTLLLTIVCGFVSQLIWMVTKWIVQPLQRCLKRRGKGNQPELAQNSISEEEWHDKMSSYSPSSFASRSNRHMDVLDMVTPRIFGAQQPAGVVGGGPVAVPPQTFTGQTGGESNVAERV